MLKKLGSDLLYLVLKTIDKYDGIYFVIDIPYLSFIAERVEDANNEERNEIKKEILFELSEGDYTHNNYFLENLDDIFEKSPIINYKEWFLYRVIYESYVELLVKLY